MILPCALRLLNIATTAFIGLLIGALVAVVANIVGGTPTRMLITIIASVVIGAGFGIVWVIRGVRYGERPAQREPYLAVLWGRSTGDRDGWREICRCNGRHEVARR